MRAESKFSNNQIKAFFKDHLLQGYLDSAYQAHFMCLIGFIGFPLYYFIGHNIYSPTYENFSLCMMGSLLCLGFLLKNKWPNSLSKLYLLYWYLLVTYCLPFFFTYMVLKNNFDKVSAMCSLVALFLCILLLDWVAIILFYFLGVIVAWLLYALVNPQFFNRTALIQYIIVSLFVLVLGIAINRKTALIQKHKLHGMTLLSRSIAHELRTPLLSIKSAANGINRYLPIIFDGYQQALAHHLPVDTIRKAHLDNLIPALKSIEFEVSYSNTFINMLLTNVTNKQVESENSEKFFISECVNHALERYPFQKNERKKIHWNPQVHDFQAYAIKMLLIYVLFNLLKNAFYFISTAGKGEIYIDLQQGKEFNTLHFKDTGAGISPKNLKRIFETFFTTVETHTGIGLTFNKTVMENLGGNIRCDSVEGDYTEFILSFPRL